MKKNNKILAWLDCFTRPDFETSTIILVMFKGVD
jgi:hypothetical protein